MLWLTVQAKSSTVSDRQQPTDETTSLLLVPTSTHIFGVYSNLPVSLDSLTLDAVWDLLINCHLLYHALSTKAFSVSAPAAWNSLSHLTVDPPVLFSSFVHTLKTELFDTAYSEHSTYSTPSWASD